jgi:predicted Rossmann-fold nucleotide-binding protein
LAEILTWRQLNLITEPIGLLNTNSFFDALVTQMKKMSSEGFLKEENLSQLKINANPQQLLTMLGVLHN